MHTCPHQNRSCRDGAPCGPCAGTTVRDGEAVRVGLMFRDGVQTAIADGEADARAAADHRRIAEFTRNAAEVAAHADRFTRAIAAADHSLTHHGYAASLDFTPRPVQSFD